MGGKLHLKLNTGERPIANKYREGKMKRPLKRELKVLEIVKREALETDHAAGLHGIWVGPRVPLWVAARLPRAGSGSGINLCQ